jgi:hypothetical protein
VSEPTGTCPLCSRRGVPITRDGAIKMERICGVISNSGPNGEPLACAYPPHADGEHSWATLPTFSATTDRDRQP